jgi:hypothetical protein
VKRTDLIVLPTDLFDLILLIFDEPVEGGEEDVLKALVMQLLDDRS